MCRDAPAKIVVSSTWRVGETRDSFAAVADASGLPSILLHEDWATPVLQANRQKEIDDWLRRHAEVAKWAIVDDGIGLDEASPRLVSTDYDDGLQFAHVLRLCALLDVDVGKWMERAGIKFTASDRRLIESVRKAAADAPDAVRE